MTFFLNKAKFFLWYFSHFKVPLIGYLKPKLIQLDDEIVIVKIPLTRRSKNHLHSMYFGALSVGADLAGGLHGYYYANKLKQPISLAFKAVEAQFLRRPHSDVYFVGEMGMKVRAMMDEANKTKKRINQTVKIKAFINYPDKPEEVAQFQLELSIKIKTSFISLNN